MRVLITGVSGFVGGYLCEHLVAQRDLVVGLSRSGRGPEGVAGLDRDVRFERFDLAEGDEDELADLIRRKQPEAIYHLAAQSNPQASTKDPRGTWVVNLGGTLNLLEAAKASGIKPRILVVGSGVCYGNPPREFAAGVSEACPLRPNNPYSSSKAAADLLAVQHHLSDGTDVVIARPFNHAGPRQSSTYVLSALARQVAEFDAGRRERVEVGNLEVTRDFTDVRDVVRGYRMLIEKGIAGEIYNLGSGRGVLLRSAVEMLGRFASRPAEIHVDPARVRPVDQPLLVADASKLRAAVGWEPLITIEQTLEDMFAHWRRNLD